MFIKNILLIVISVLFSFSLYAQSTLCPTIEALNLADGSEIKVEDIYLNLTDDLYTILSETKNLDICSNDILSLWAQNAFVLIELDLVPLNSEYVTKYKEISAYLQVNLQERQQDFVENEFRFLIELVENRSFLFNIFNK